MWDVVCNAWSDRVKYRHLLIVGSYRGFGHCTSKTVSVLLVKVVNSKMSVEQATYELVKENNMLLKAIYQKLLENESNDFQTNVAANIFADVLYGKRQ